MRKLWCKCPYSGAAVHRRTCPMGQGKALPPRQAWHIEFEFGIFMTFASAALIYSLP